MRPSNARARHLATHLWSALLLLGMLWALSCTNAEPETQIAVKNGGTEPIDVTVGEGVTALTFGDIAGSTTSAFQVANFDSYGGVDVRVGAASASPVDLNAGERNVIDVGAEGQILRVRIATGVVGGGEGGW